MSVENITGIYNAQIAGVWANTDLNPQKDGDDTRSKVLKDLSDTYMHSLKLIYNQAEAESDEIDWEDPFFAAIKGPGNPNWKEPEASPEPHEHNLEEIDQE